MFQKNWAENKDFLFVKNIVGVACLSKDRLPHVGSPVTIKPGSKQNYWLYHCDVSNNSRRNGVAIVWTISKDPFRFD